MNISFRKHIPEIPIEPAHGGSGSRQLLLSQLDSISENIEAMTKGYLPAGGVFDWHSHMDIDEIFVVLHGTGYVELDDTTRLDYKTDDILYIRKNISHRVINTGTDENIFYFIRVRSL